jgi:hypothetical protein
MDLKNTFKEGNMIDAYIVYKTPAEDDIYQTIKKLIYLSKKGLPVQTKFNGITIKINPHSKNSKNVVQNILDKYYKELTKRGR